MREFPFLGSPRPDLGPQARMLVEAPYLILYRVLEDHVQIVRILHAARDISAASFALGEEE